MKTNREPTRGVRNKNPLNIRWSNTVNWLGQTGHDNKGFCQFVTMQYGLRAAFALLRTYNRRYGCKTIRQIVSRWAPPTENDTAAYIRHVAERTGFSPDVAIEYNTPQMRAVVRQMAVIESQYDPPQDILLLAQQMIL